MFDYFYSEAVNNSSDYSMVDLHGLSPDDSRASVNLNLARAQEKNINEFRFVTGRGNHINSKGKRGTLYEELPTWITDENRLKIATIKKQDGYYEIHMKPFVEKQGTIHYLLDALEKESKHRQVEKIKELAASGDNTHQFYLACCYQAGDGVTRDEKAAVKWFEKSAENGNHMAKYRLAGCYWQGRGVRRDDKKAIALFEEAASQNNSLSCELLGDLCNRGTTISDHAKAFCYYEKAAALELERARRKLADAYFYGKGVAKNQTKAFELYKIAADKGNPHAAYNLAYCHFSAIGTEKNMLLGIK